MTEHKKDIAINFKKAQSHIAKILDMLEHDAYCIDVMQQNLAVIGILKSAHQMLLENHVNTCFRDALVARNEKRKQEMIQEILRVVKLFNK